MISSSYDNIPPEAIAEFIQWFRGLLQHRKQTHASLAEEMGLHRVTVSRWAAGMIFPDSGTRIKLNKIAAGCGYAPLPVVFKYKVKP